MSTLAPLSRRRSCAEKKQSEARSRQGCECAHLYKDAKGFSNSEVTDYASLFLTLTAMVANRLVQTQPRSCMQHSEHICF